MLHGTTHSLLRMSQQQLSPATGLIGAARHLVYANATPAPSAIHGVSDKPPFAAPRIITRRRVALRTPSNISGPPFSRHLHTNPPGRWAKDSPIVASTAWQKEWAAATAELTTAETPFEDAAARLRALVRTGLLRFTDLRDQPERFFLAHRLLGSHAVPQ